MSLLTINHLQKSFDNLEVLKDISLEVNEGEVLAIIGPSGSGKSTLLRCATMLEKADDGEIIYEGHNNTLFAGKNERKEIRKNFGLVFQNFHLFPHRSVLQNVMDAPVKTQKKPTEQSKKEAMQLLEKMGLADKADNYPQQLSGGQCQRVSIARALALNPKILFFDEPTSALDPELIGEILKVIKDLAAEHMTMVIVTHEMNFAKNVADKVIFMDKGVIALEGSPDYVFNSDNDRMKEFLGRLT